MSAGGIKVEIPFRIWVPHPGGLRIRAPHGDFAQLRRTGGEEEWGIKTWNQSTTGGGVS